MDNHGQPFAKTKHSLKYQYCIVANDLVGGEWEVVCQSVARWALEQLMIPCKNHSSQEISAVADLSMLLKSS